MSTIASADILVRGAGAEDLDHLVWLRARWRGQDVTPEFTERFTQWFRAEGQARWWWLATAGPEAVGMVNLKLFERMPSPHRPPSRWGYLANLFVLESHRRQDVGGRLVAALLQRARDEELVRVVLSPSDASIPLYERHGFTPAHGLLVNPLSRS